MRKTPNKSNKTDKPKGKPKKNGFAISPGVKKPKRVWF